MDPMMAMMQATGQTDMISDVKRYVNLADTAELYRVNREEPERTRGGSGVAPGPRKDIPWWVIGVVLAGVVAILWSEGGDK